MDRNLAIEIVRVTEAAALSSSRLMGRGNKEAADFAAVEAMRSVFEDISINGKIVIGEGERDKAPMLYIGEKVGKCRKENLHVDVAVDPLEGTNLCAYGRPNALSVVAIAEENKLLHAPDVYMEKIAVGFDSEGVIDLDKSPESNLKAIAEFKGVYVEDLTAVVLERKRHSNLISKIRKAGARVQLISDGDISAAISTCISRSGIDVLFGIGGAPEGVLAAAALRCLNGNMQARLIVSNEKEEQRSKNMGIENINKKWKMEELASGNVIFAATGVTSGDILKGVRYFKGGAYTHSMVMRSSSGTIRFINTEHHFDKKPKFSKKQIFDI